MPVSQQSKRKQSEIEDYDNCSDFEDELEKSNNNRNSKKKKIILQSESESDSSDHLSKTAEDDDADSDEDKPINEIFKKLEFNKKLNKKNLSIDSSDDEPLVNKAALNHSKTLKSTKSESEENDSETFDEGAPINKVVKTSEIKGKSEKVSLSSNNLVDESLAAKISSYHSEITEVSKSANSESEENGGETSDENAPTSKMVKMSKQIKMSKKVVSSDSSDDELLVQNSSTDSEIKKSSKKLSQPEESGCSSSSDDEPLSNLTDKTNGILKQDKSLSCDSDVEPLATNQSLKPKTKNKKNDSISYDEDESFSKLQKPSNVKNKKTKNLSDNKIEHLKKYLRLSGIHIQSYDKLFADCRSIKAKTEKLLSILHEKGLKGRPTIEKCKKLRRKIETKKEISELDISNIIQSEGRPKRGSGGITQKASKNENLSPKKRFSRLKDIIDSEESD